MELIEKVRDSWPPSEWKLNSKDHVIFNKFFRSARALLPQWGKSASACVVPHWVLRPFWAHERSKPGARYARRCFNESCLSASCFSEASSVIILREVILVYLVLKYRRRRPSLLDLLFEFGIIHDGWLITISPLVFGRLSQCTWVLKVSVLETGHTRYFSTSGSDPQSSSLTWHCRWTSTSIQSVKCTV